ENGNIRIELHQVSPTTPPHEATQSPSSTINDHTPTLPYTTLSFSQPYLSFGFLIPGEPVVRTDTVSLYTTSPRGATLLIMQNNPPQAEGARIPDTSCDNGSCSFNHAGVWVSPLTFGFGVRCEKS